MNIFTSPRIAKAFARAARLMSEPITIKGVVYQAVIDKFNLSREMRMNGFRVDFELVAIIPIGDMATPPRDDDEGEYKGQKVRIVRDGVTSDSWAYTIKFGHAS